MKILGLNFGHDASLALYVDGKLVLFRELERYTRLKHNVGLKTDEIKNFLNEANLVLSDIDFAAICGTQWYKARHSKDIKLTPTEPQAFMKFYENKMCKRVDIARGIELGGTDNWYGYTHHADRFKGYLTATPLPIKINCDSVRPYKAKKIDELISTAYRPTQNLVPYTLEIYGIQIPSIFVTHHVAHAYYGYEYQAFKNSIIISHDGGWPHIPFNSGGVYLPKDNELVAIWDPRFYFGQIYQIAGELAGFSSAEAPGKLMGLASYGFYPSELVVKLKNIFKDIKKGDSVEDFERLRKNILEDIEKNAPLVELRPGSSEYDFSSLHKNSIGIATLTQALCESLWAEQTKDIANFIEVTDLGRLEEIIVVGGFSLNCPSNYRMQKALPHVNVVPLAGGSDMGTSIGAAKFASSLFSNATMSVKRNSVISSAFPPRKSINEKEELGSLEVVYDAEVSKKKIEAWYANELIKGKIFCHYQGESEVGPRALGARSIIAHASNKNIRNIINIKKGREIWRPLAPMVARDNFEKYFYKLGNIDDGAACMLYTYSVKQPEKIPACTHADNTARVQICENDFLIQVLKQLEFQDTTPVIINTSFNVAGEPLVETINQAVTSFKKLGFDYLYCEGSVYKHAKS